MNILHVIPISRGVGKETLSYFSLESVAIGSVVKIPLRNRQVYGLVIEQEEAQHMKAELKQSAFSLRKITAKSYPLFLPECIRAAKNTAHYAATSTGNVLGTISTKSILELAGKFKTPVALEQHTGTFELLGLQADEQERMSHYKSLIREQFARKKSVFFCLPTLQDIKRVTETLPKGITDYTYTLNTSLPKKQLTELWNSIITNPHPVLIIATGSFLSIPRQDIGMIIIERESSSQYKSQLQPYIDIRTFVEYIAKEINAKVIFGDILLRTETLWRTKNAELTELNPLKFRLVSSSTSTIVDMKQYKTLENPEFKIISTPLEELIQKNKKNSERMFIFGARRGLSPITICGDCGSTVLCSKCSAPVILHKHNDIPFFLCHRCGEKRTAEERCRICTSWKLTTLGIGVELIEETLQQMFPDIKIFRIDKDTIKTHKQAIDTMTRFLNAPGSILIGTEMALLYLTEQIENSSVAAIDSLFSIPDFRINEKIMNILLRIRSITKHHHLIQTRSHDQHIFEYAIKGNLLDFYREEIESRKHLEYPPFTTLIKITIRGSIQSVNKDVTLITNTFKEYNPLIFPAFIEKIKRQTIIHAIIRIPKKEWVLEPLVTTLQSLPPHISVNVDPENLL